MLLGKFKQKYLLFITKYSPHSSCMGARWPSDRASDSKARGQGLDPHPGRHVVSLSKTHLLPKSTGNTQETVAASRHDWKIVYWDVKQKQNETKKSFKLLITFFICSLGRSLDSDSDSDDYSILDPPYMRPTISSILHSRSRSAVRRSFDDESLSSSDLDTSGKPPFVVRHVGLHCRVASLNCSSCHVSIYNFGFILLFSLQVTITDKY